MEDAIEELVRWKTAIQCGHSHDVSKGYFIDAEPHMELQWNQIIFPLIRDLEFTTVLDLACGHGRNSEFLRRHSKSPHLVDINQSCIDACRMRFGDTKDGTRFRYHVTDGNHLKMIENESITLVYSWDSMVHFDKLIIRDYLLDIQRVLKPGRIGVPTSFELRREGPRQQLGHEHRYAVRHARQNYARIRCCDWA